MNRALMVVAGATLSFVGMQAASAQTVIVDDGYAPPVYASPGPVYAAPAPLYGAPVVVEPPRVYAAPAPIYRERAIVEPREVVVTEPAPLVTPDSGVTYTAW